MKENEVGSACGRGEKVRRKRALGRASRRWEYGIKMDLREVGWGVWSGFSWLRIRTVGGLL
jgi:hypothetical protein